jgi:phospholipid transport system substrate-binding protein
MNRSRFDHARYRRTGHARPEMDGHELAIYSRQHFVNDARQGTPPMIRTLYSIRSSGGARAAVAIWLILAVVLFAMPKPAFADTPAEDFVRINVEKGLAILNNHTIPDAQRRTEFRTFLTGLTDIRRIALFTLGAARRTATPAQIDQFVDAFRNYAVAVYESRLKAYAGQSLKPTGATEHAANDFVVTTVLVDPTGKTEAQGEPIEVDFRVLGDNGHFVVIDAAIAGVWLGLEERDQFTAFLEENNGNLNALISHLNMLTDRLRGGGPATPTH